MNNLIKTNANIIEPGITCIKPWNKCHARKLRSIVGDATLETMELYFAKLSSSDSRSLLKKYLTKPLFNKLKYLRTPSFHSTLLDCIQSGVVNLDSMVGIYAADAEAYKIFADLFDPIIQEYHIGFKRSDKHPAINFGDINSFGNLDPNGNFILSTRVRCMRSIEGFPFCPCLTENQYEAIGKKVSSTLAGLDGELKGEFYPLKKLDMSVRQHLVDRHYLFKQKDRFLQTANAQRYFPQGRGIYYNENKTFLVWCNREDHLSIISMQSGGNLGDVYRRLVTGVSSIEKYIPFSHDKRLGFLTFCPTNLGTTIRSSVLIEIPKLKTKPNIFQGVLKKFNLEVRGTNGVHTEPEGSIYDISNRRRVGLTEYEAVKEMYEGISEIIELEKKIDKKIK